MNVTANECGTHNYCTKASKYFSEQNRNKFNSKKREGLFILYEPEKGKNFKSITP